MSNVNVDVKVMRQYSTVFQISLTFFETKFQHFGEKKWLRKFAGTTKKIWFQLFSYFFFPHVNLHLWDLRSCQRQREKTEIPTCDTRIRKIEGTYVFLLGHYFLLSICWKVEEDNFLKKNFSLKSTKCKTKIRPYFLLCKNNMPVASKYLYLLPIYIFFLMKTN